MEHQSQIRSFLAPNSPILPNGASLNDSKHSQYLSTSSKQTYLPITNHFSELNRVSGKLLRDVWSSSPKFDNFWPQISPILPTGTSDSDKNHSKYPFTSSKQTHLPITNHFGELKRVSGKLLSDFSGLPQTIRKNSSQNSAIWIWFSSHFP